jgi:hypothetical protein
LEYKGKKMRRMKDVYIEMMDKLMDEHGVSQEDASEVAYYQLREALAQEYPGHRELESLK